MEPVGSLPWITSHLQERFPSSLYKIIITMFLKELASKTFWICTMTMEKVISVSDVIHVKQLSELVCYSSLPCFLRSILILYSYLFLSFAELLCCICCEIYLSKFCISFLSFQSEICSVICNITDLTDIVSLVDLY
jgi:hypothetical protein